MEKATARTNKEKAAAKERRKAKEAQADMQLSNGSIRCELPGPGGSVV